MLKSEGENPFLRGKPSKEHLNLTFHEEGDPLDGATGPEREEKLLEIAESAERQFKASLARIQELILSHNPFQILAHFGYYDQLVLDPSDGSEEYRPIEQSALEWLQALILQIPQNQVSAILKAEPKSNVFIELNGELHKAQQGFAMKRLGRKSSEPEIAHAAEMVRHHTAFIRNEGYPSQIKRMRRAVFSPLDEEFEKREGVTLTELDDVLWRLTELFKDRMDADLRQRKEILQHSTSREVISAFADLIGQKPAQVSADMAEFAHDLGAVRRAITHYIDSRNYRHFFFRAEELQALFDRPIDITICRKLLEKMSIGWGALNNQNPEHFILANPVWKKPFIAVGNYTYFLPAVAMVQSFGLDAIESLLEAHSDLKKKYRSRTRAEYLEHRVEELARQSFAKAKVFRGLRWRDEVGTEYETDILVILDGHALIFECKSAAIRARAQRGDPAALKQELIELIDEPSLQGKRFGDFILSSRSVITLKDVAGTEHQIDFTALLRVTTVNVLLDYVGPVATQFHLLKSAGIRRESSSPVATIALHDLECVLEILDRPAVAFHYFRRRAELEANCEIISTGEMGLLALYLATSFDLGDFEGQGNSRLVVPTLGQELDPYFMGRELGMNSLKPVTKLSQWWIDILEQFEERAFSGWMEASYALLCTNFDRQNEFREKCEQLKEEALACDEMQNDTCIMINGAKGSRVAIMCIVMGNQTRTETRQIVNERIAMVEEEHQAARSLAICISAISGGVPYLGAYFHCPELEVLGNENRRKQQ